MNRPIARLFGFVCVLFAVLIGFTSRWTVFDAPALRGDSVLNHRPLIEAQLIPRGQILAADGSTLAFSKRGAGGVYSRVYPDGALFAPAIGYSFADYGDAGLEQFRNDALTGQLDRSQLGTILDQLSGTHPVGDDVVTTLDPQAQRVAVKELAGRPGAVVAMVPSTGAIKVFADDPTYDPNLLGSMKGRAQVNAEPGDPQVNRVTESEYPPGSTFKVVTAIAAIDSGHYTPQSLVNGDSPKLFASRPLSNDGNRSWGDISLTTALTNSVNTVWAQVALSLGQPTLAHYMDLLGFNHAPPLDFPSDELRPSGEYFNGNLTSPESSLVDIGRMGIGQDHLGVTPLQMAMVASAVADGGRLMAPHITQKVIDSDGRAIETIAPREVAQVMKPKTAAEVGEMMAQVVQEGTGVAAQLSGIQVAGKTGTAQTRVANVSQVWFIAFAPVVHPKMAIAVTIQASTGQGATVAAPIAKAVLQTLLDQTGAGE